jgi:hypothetical protein
MEPSSGRVEALCLGPQMLPHSGFLIILQYQKEFFEYLHYGPR